MVSVTRVTQFLCSDHTTSALFFSYFTHTCVCFVWLQHAASPQGLYCVFSSIKGLSCTGIAWPLPLLYAGGGVLGCSDVLIHFLGKLNFLFSLQVCMSYLSKRRGNNIQQKGFSVFVFAALWEMPVPSRGSRSLWHVFSLNKFVLSTACQRTHADLGPGGSSLLHDLCSDSNYTTDIQHISSEWKHHTEFTARIHLNL